LLTTLSANSSVRTLPTSSSSAPQATRASSRWCSGARPSTCSGTAPARSSSRVDSTRGPSGARRFAPVRRSGLDAAGVVGGLGRLPVGAGAQAGDAGLGGADAALEPPPLLVERRAG